MGSWVSWGVLRLKKKSTAILSYEDISKIAQFVNSDMDSLREWVENLPIRD